ncbi:MAG: hypothetical protein LBJ67_17175 [Planctomycetaceae bacterium]|jgi:hypothetical protein|nr:hypothetical protein [Planctomycetaceae bacterium]
MLRYKNLVWFVAGISVVAGILICEAVLSVNAEKSAVLSERQMAGIWGGEEKGCQATTDSTSCFPIGSFPNVSTHCIMARVTVLQPKTPQQTDEEYQEYVASHQPTCDFFYASGSNNLTLGTGAPFTTAKSGGDTTKELVEIEPERCLRAIKCKNGSNPPAIGQSEEYWYDMYTKKTRCTTSENPLSYCINCVTDGEKPVDDALQPKKYTCQTIE